MAFDTNLTPTPGDDNVPAWDAATPLLGGDSTAPLNRQAQALLNKITYVKGGGFNDGTVTDAKLSSDSGVLQLILAKLLFLATGVGAVVRSLLDRLRDVVNVTDFMTAEEVADVRSYTGALNVKAAIQAAHAAHKRVRYPGGAYNVGSITSAAPVVSFSGRGNGIQILNDGHVKFIATVTSGLANFFYFTGNSDVVIGDFEFTDPTYTPVAEVTGLGLRAIVLENSGAQEFGNYKVGQVIGRNIKAPFAIGSFLPRTGAIRGIVIDHLVAIDCYYGFSAANDGNGTRINQLTADRCFRPLFAYGLDSIKARIYNRRNRSTSGAVNISRGVDGPNTEAVDIEYVSRDNDQDIPHVLINHIDGLGGSIRGVRLKLDIESSVAYDPVRIVTYTGSGGVETATSSSNIVDGIDISGQVDAQARPVTCTAAYNTKGFLSLKWATNLSYDSTIPAQFKLTNERELTPTIAASGTAFVPGNAFVKQWVYVNEGFCDLATLVQFGSTTTYGTGTYTFSIPYVCRRNWVGSVRIFDSGTGDRIAVVRIAEGGSTAEIRFENGATALGATAPITFAANDRVEFSIRYPTGQ